MESMIIFSFRSKTIVSSLSETDSKILSIFKRELLMTIINNIQQLTVVAKISPEFLHQPMATKDDYYRSYFLTSFKAAFSKYRIDIESVQNMYQVDLLSSLESYQIDLRCI